MLVLIDKTGNRAIARHANFNLLSDLAYIQFANLDTIIIDEALGRDYAQLDAAQLLGVLKSIGVDNLDGSAAYQHLVLELRGRLPSCEWLVPPFSPDALSVQASKIKEADATPYAFNPEGSAPVKLKAWTLEPQRNRPRTARRTAASPVAAANPPPWVKPSDIPAGPTASPAARTEEATMASAKGKGNKGKATATAATAEAAPATPDKAKGKDTTKAKGKAAATQPAAPAKGKGAAAKGKATAAPAASAAPAKGKAKGKAAEAAPAATGNGRRTADRKNGIPRPKSDGVCGKLWDFLDKDTAKRMAHKDPAERKPTPPSVAFEWATKAEMNDATARTQYQRWRVYNGYGKAAKGS